MDRPRVPKQKDVNYCVVTGTYNMTLFVVTHKHESAECGRALEAFAKAGTNANIEVVENTLFCTSPYGHHGSTFVAEADDESEVKAFLAELNLGQNSFVQSDRIAFNPG